MSERVRTVVAGAGGGTAASLVSYVVTYLAVGSTVESSAARRLFEALGGDLPTWKVVGWVFFNAHAVSTRVPGLFGSESVNLLSQVDAFPTLLYVVPPLALLAAGAAVAAITDDGRAGVATVCGSLPVAAVATLLFSISVAGTTLGPPLLPAVALAGVCYPALFGGAGGLLWARLVE